MNYRANLTYINSLRTAKGGIDTAMLRMLAVPKAPRTGWVRRLASAPFLVEKADWSQLEAFWEADSINIPEPDWKECAEGLYWALNRLTPECGIIAHYKDKDEFHDHTVECPAMKKIKAAMQKYEELILETNRC